MGGDQSGLSGVKKIYATDMAFAAVKEDGSLFTWGNQDQVVV